MTRIPTAIAKYGLTQAQFDAIFDSQEGRCAICGVNERALADAPFPADRKLHIDHDHARDFTAVRGLLCYRCNYDLEAYIRGIDIVHPAGRQYYLAKTRVDQRFREYLKNRKPILPLAEEFEEALEFQGKLISSFTFGVEKIRDAVKVMGDGIADGPSRATASEYLSGLFPDVYDDRYDGAFWRQLSGVANVLRSSLEAARAVRAQSIAELALVIAIIRVACSCADQLATGEEASDLLWGLYDRIAEKMPDIDALYDLDDVNDGQRATAIAALPDHLRIDRWFTRLVESGSGSDIVARNAP